MKRIFALLLLVMTVHFVNAQVPLYISQRTPPPSVLLLPDGKTKWNLKSNLQRGKPLFIIFFSPSCDHCKHETEDLIKNINKFRGVQIVMATTQPFEDMKAFANKYRVANYGITIGRDIAYVMAPYFEIGQLPFMAVYDRNKKFVTKFEGTVGVPKILKAFGR